MSKQATFKELFTATDVGSNVKSHTARQHCFIALPTELCRGARLSKATGGHCHLQLLVQFSPIPRLLPNYSLAFSLKLKFKIFFFSHFPKPARFFIAASWQHFARDDSLVPEYLKAVFQTPDVSLTCRYKIKVSAFLAQIYCLQSNQSLPEYTTQPEKSTDKRLSLSALSEHVTSLSWVSIVTQSSVSLWVVRGYLLQVLEFQF